MYYSYNFIFQKNKTLEIKHLVERFQIYLSIMWQFRAEASIAAFFIGGGDFR